MNLFATDWEDMPAGSTVTGNVCAIGDVHGYLDHLRALAGWIEAQAPSARLVMLGDYVDRGIQSIDTLSFLDALAERRPDTILLRGNHDDYLSLFLTDPHCSMDFIDFWSGNGGMATLGALGIGYEDFLRTDMAALQARANAALPGAARRCLDRLVTLHRQDDVLFVHAGVHPTAPLDPLSDDLLEIRQPFLAGEDWSHDFIVVHGHSIAGPDVRPHRIALDSGAYKTGILTAAEMVGDRLRFIAATRSDDVEALKSIRRRGPRPNEVWTRL